MSEVLSASVAAIGLSSLTCRLMACPLSRYYHPMPTPDAILQQLIFPTQYLDVGEALTRACGGDVAAYYRHCGIAWLPGDMPGHSLTGVQLRRSNEWMLAICPPGMPPLVSFIQHFPVTSHGAMGMLAITARTLGEALDGALHYFPLVMPAYTLRRQDTQGRVHLIAEPRFDFGPVSHFFTETVLAAFMQLAPFLSRQPALLPEMHFTHAPMGRVEDYERAFPCRFAFGSTQNKLVLDKEALAIPLLTPSVSSHRVLKAGLEQQARLLGVSSPVTADVRRRLQQALRENRTLTIEALAAQLAMSSRTLSRRLQEEGATLPRLRTEVGCEYAELLLLETDKPVAQVAATAGFQDAAAFTRAFRRCRGVTPTALRAGRN